MDSQNNRSNVLPFGSMNNLKRGFVHISESGPNGYSRNIYVEADGISEEEVMENLREKISRIEDFPADTKWEELIENSQKKAA